MISKFNWDISDRVCLCSRVKILGTQRELTFDMHSLSWMIVKTLCFEIPISGAIFRAFRRLLSINICSTFIMFSSVTAEIEHTERRSSSRLNLPRLNRFDYSLTVLYDAADSPQTATKHSWISFGAFLSSVKNFMTLRCVILSKSMFTGQTLYCRRSVTGTGSAELIKIRPFYNQVLYYKTIISAIMKKIWSMVGPGIF
jgi:hypothetical protein